MIRKIINIDEEKCNGCGACAKACHEGAIEIVDGKAKLIRDDYCDGLGDCLPTCPTDAISFVEREALAYDEKAVLMKKSQKAIPTCASMINKYMGNNTVSKLRQFPVQIKLVPIKAPYFSGANLLIAADCTAYAYANMHNDFMDGKITLIGCPKLDSVDYSEKLTEIFTKNDIIDVTLVRMEVPCCGGLEYAIEKAVKNSGKDIPVKVNVISTDGRIIKGQV